MKRLLRFDQFFVSSSVFDSSVFEIKAIFCHFLLHLFRNLTLFLTTRERKNKNNNVIRLREQSYVLLFSLLQKIIVSSERSAFKLLLEEF